MIAKGFNQQSLLIQQFCTVPEFKRPEGLTNQKLIELETVHAEMRLRDAVWRCARASKVDLDLIRALCEDFVQVYREYQRLRWGRVRDRVCATRLMR